MSNLNIELGVITNDNDKVLVSFSYLASILVQISSSDKICLYDSEDPSEPLACAKIGNPNDHWSDQSFKYKKGQVSLDISRLTLSREKSYKLAYVSHRQGSEVIITETTLILNEDGMLVELNSQTEQGSLPSPTLDDYACISHSTADPSINTGSYDQCPPSSSHADSSSFVVIQEGDSQTVEPEALFVIDSTSSIPENSPVNSLATESSCSEPENTETSEQPVPSHLEDDSFDVVPSIHEDLPVPQEISSQQLSSVGESPKPKPRQRKTSLEPRKADEMRAAELSTNPADMSVSVNLEDRFISQKEGQMYKKANKDLLQKQKKLTAIMEGMRQQLKQLEEQKAGATSSEDTQTLQDQIDHLLGKIAELKEKLNGVVSENLVLKSENQSQKAALAEKQAEIDALKRKVAPSQKAALGEKQAEIDALKRKLAQVTMERDSHFERNGVLLNEVQDKEKENEVLRSENMVLQGKLHREDKRRQKKEVENEQRRVMAREPVKVQPSPPNKQPQNGHSEAQAQPAHNRPAQNGPLAQARPLDLPLAGGAKLKPASPQPANQPSKHHSRDTQPRRQHQTPQPTKTVEPERSDPPASKPRQQPAGSRLQRQSDGTRNVSGQRVNDLAGSLRGASTVVCPICQKTLHARDNEYSVLLHVEHCLRNS